MQNKYLNKYLNKIVCKFIAKLHKYRILFKDTIHCQDLKKTFSGCYTKKYLKWSKDYYQEQFQHNTCQKEQPKQPGLQEKVIQVMQGL